MKGIHLEGLRVLGSPEKFATYYYKEGIDELMYMDVVASLYGRNSLLSLISKAAEEIFIPITVGGGLRTVQDIRQVLHAGADKVVLNTAAIKNPNLISEAAHIFGSSTIVVAIEAIRQPSGQYHAFVNNGREQTDVEVIAWAERVQALGAGEIVITSVDAEGTGGGFDLELIRLISGAVGVPVIAHGGAGNAKDVVDAIKLGKADAVAMGSLFHYHAIGQIDHSNSQNGNMTIGNRDFLNSNRSNKRISAISVKMLKQNLLESQISIRNSTCPPSNLGMA